KPDMDRRGSNHSFLPSSTSSGAVTTAGSMGLISSLARRSACTCVLRPMPAAMARQISLIFINNVLLTRTWTSMVLRPCFLALIVLYLDVREVDMDQGLISTRV